MTLQQKSPKTCHEDTSGESGERDTAGIRETLHLTALLGLRLEQGYSQEEFAFLVNLHQTYISSVERGERNVTIGTADRVAISLGTTLSAMFAELEEEQETSE